MKLQALAVHQIRSKKVDPNTKLRWMRSLIRQVEALVKLAEDLNNTQSKSTADMDLATYLSSLEKKIPEIRHKHLGVLLMALR